MVTFELHTEYNKVILGINKTYNSHYLVETCLLGHLIHANHFMSSVLILLSVSSTQLSTSCRFVGRLAMVCIDASFMLLDYLPYHLHKAMHFQIPIPICMKKIPIISPLNLQLHILNLCLLGHSHHREEILTIHLSWTAALQCWKIYSPHCVICFCAP